MTGRDSARGALFGLAIGDALGMPTQLMSRDAIQKQFGTLGGFEPAAADHPLAAGMAAGSITDDTEQALLVARLLIEGAGHVEGRRFAAELVRWEDGMRARGSLDLLGPSTKRAVDAVVDGEPVEESGRFGTTNGAAMRVAPVGIVMPSADVTALVDRVEEVSRVSHNTGVAIAGASAIAAVVSAGIDGATRVEAIDFALEAARIGATRGYWVAAADIAARIQLARDVVDPNDRAASLDRIYRVVGTSLASQESIPAAFGLLELFPQNPWDGALAAASLGGDTDTVAAMFGAMGGALYGAEAFPIEARATIERVNSLGLDAVADYLLTLR